MRDLPNVPLFLLAALLASPVAAEAARSALGNDGELYQLHAASFGELFAGDDALPADRPVLALDVLTGAERRRLLVPGSDDEALESASFLLYDRAAGVLTTVWESRGDDGFRLTLASYDTGGWSERHEILRAEKELGVAHAVTRERYVFTLPDEREVVTERSILHLLWRPESGPDQALRYSPLIFVDGRFVGWVPEISVLGLFAPGVKTAAPAPSLDAALALAAGGRELTVTFVDPRDGQLVTLGVSSLPLELAYLADRIRDRVLETYGGGGVDDEIRTQIIHGGIRTQIIHGGAEVGADETLVSYVADTAVAWSEIFFDLHPETTVAEYADALRAFVVDLTSAILSTGRDAEGETIEIDLGGLAAGQPVQVLDVEVLARRAAPEVGEGLTRIYAGADGRAVVVAWHDAEAGAVRWVESAGGGDRSWSEVRSLTLDEGMTLGHADVLFQRRVE